MIRLSYAHFCEAVTFTVRDAVRLPTFHTILPAFQAEGPGGYTLPSCVLAVGLEASIAEGPMQDVEVCLVDADARPVVEARPKFELWFRPTALGHPLRSLLVVPLNGVTLPRPGDYAFEVRLTPIFDGQTDRPIIGTVPLIVHTGEPVPYL